MLTKICTKCKIQKDLDSFYKLKNGKYGVHSICKSCLMQKQVDYYKNNSEKVKTYQQFYALNNSDKILERKKKYYQKNTDRMLKYHKEYHINNILKINDYQKKYRELNPDKIKIQQATYNKLNFNKRKKYYKKWSEENREKINDYMNNKYKTNLNFRIKCDLRTRIFKALKNNQKSGHTLELIGCSIEFLKQHIESQFKDGMNWNNQGRGGWHIDHIKPCASFDLTKELEQRKCFHYSNLQPLWEFDNLSKGSKIY